jgi:Zn finger protein HypA/HybF involved in hydrogenase expression
MDEYGLAQRVLQTTLGAVVSLGTRCVRCINLSVYDQRLDPEMFATSFETLARGTVAQDARVRLRFCTTESLTQLPVHVFAKLETDRVRLDSVEIV